MFATALPLQPAIVLQAAIGNPTMPLVRNRIVDHSNGQRELDVPIVHFRMLLRLWKLFRVVQGSLPQSRLFWKSFFSFVISTSSSPSFGFAL